ncbi:class IIb bacteriocin, lactobin A/cerein 7B family [Shewanella chilikensis]|uniref:Lactobin A/cerein 7B family class IIb bacteriocin n=1 Tax=Shewanella chilikensis TaxID=558541 RepID=A0ABX5PHV5_9GAMM|nr:class IIb bacteriocin, lactobin A/cerein 7B family [Shewanella chilikensis]MCE9789211.1 class IIb bacteriocin, lactobin A/cerein 7B family [Shewanella chilikensis]MCL1155228.1 class IIb bacteriocin, lactobin A/cerein 7B family [Shewanella chilikensis]PYE54000.1 lactobin A/cerein 7B family class IIb bacteriocin [Shewanella chilikensis]GGZ35861.1 hypothetical protein GCM10007105_23840 [Shewanella chilikensis]
MTELNKSEIVKVSGGFAPVVVAAMWLGRAGAVAGLAAFGYYFYNREN